MTTNKSDTSVHKVVDDTERTMYTKPAIFERIQFMIAVCSMLTKDSELSFEIRRAALDSVSALQKLEIELTK